MVDYDALPPLIAAARADLANSAVLDGVELSGADLSGVHATSMRMMEVALRNCTADEFTTPGVSGVDTFVGDVRVQTWRAHNGAWRDATFTSLRVGAWLADGTELVDVQITGSKVDLLSLRGARITRLTVTDCTVETLDLTGAEVTNLVVSGGSIGELLTPDARMTNLDVSGADVRMVSGPSHLRGLVISHQQLSDLAPAFAAHMGLVVKD